jgi:hypothetical protein
MGHSSTNWGSMASRMRKKTVLIILCAASVTITLILAFFMFQKGRSPFQLFSASTLIFVFFVTTSLRIIEGMEDVASDIDKVARRRKFIIRAIIMYVMTPVLIGVTFLIIPRQSAWSVAMLVIAFGLALSATVR